METGSFPETGLPPTTSRSESGACTISTGGGEREEQPGFSATAITFGRPLEFDEEFLHPIVHHLHLVVAHHPATPINQESRQEWPDQKKSKQNTSGRIGKQTKRGPASSQLHEVHLAALARGRHLGERGNKNSSRRAPPQLLALGIRGRKGLRSL